MQNNADEGRFLMKSNQKADAFMRMGIGDSITARLLSMRCQEARTQALLNQDYASVISRRDGSSLCFCVCDGVGSSYRGDFAAHYLATQLIEWLHQLKEIPRDPDRFSIALHAYLDQWAYEAQIRLKQIPIPPKAPALVREVLEDLRDTYGSETVFLGGRIDSGAWSNRPGIVHPIQALFCWMGNVTAHLLITADRRISLGGQSDKEGRWSTLHGRRGVVTTRSIPLSTIDRITIHTDGLDAIGGKLAMLTDNEWNVQAQHLLLSSRNDDMTALELQWMREKPGEEHML